MPQPEDMCIHGAHDNCMFCEAQRKERAEETPTVPGPWYVERDPADPLRWRIWRKDTDPAFKNYRSFTSYEEARQVANYHNAPIVEAPKTDPASEKFNPCKDSPATAEQMRRIIVERDLPRLPELSDEITHLRQRLANAQEIARIACDERDALKRERDTDKSILDGVRQQRDHYRNRLMTACSKLTAERNAHACTTKQLAAARESFDRYITEWVTGTNWIQDLFTAAKPGDAIHGMLGQHRSTVIKAYVDGLQVMVAALETELADFRAEEKLIKDMLAEPKHTPTPAEEAATALRFQRIKGDVAAITQVETLCKKLAEAEEAAQLQDKDLRDATMALIEAGMPKMLVTAIPVASGIRNMAHKFKALKAFYDCYFMPDSHGNGFHFLQIKNPASAGVVWLAAQKALADGDVK